MESAAGYKKRIFLKNRVAAIGQYQRLQSIGMSHAEIADVYFGRVDSVGFVAGPGRLIALVALYVGAHIHPDEFCYEGIVPIDTQLRRAL